MNASRPSRPIKCPTCKKTGDWLQGKYGPFCSHRCKLIDLGKWLGEENRISEPLPPEQLSDKAEPRAGGQSDPADNA